MTYFSVTEPHPLYNYNYHPNENTYYFEKGISKRLSEVKNNSHGMINTFLY